MRIFKYIAVGVIMLFSASTLLAETNEIETQYRRPSMYSVLVSRTDQEHSAKIIDEFYNIETPSQYNNHDLSIKVVTVPKKGTGESDIDNWLKENAIASRLIGKWFDRDIFTGECSLDLVKHRGLYNATEFDKELAARSARGIAMLEDAGEDLIGNTFVLVHEASYIDHGKRSKVAGGILRGLGLLAGVALGSQSLVDMGDNLGSITESIKGFKVKFHTRLYRLVWDDEASKIFYTQMWTQKPDEKKKVAFEDGRDTFRLEYIGEVTSSGSNTSFLGISEKHPEIMVRKACTRAIDDNIRDLQSNFEVFRVKSPITAVRDGVIDVPIGMKEGINADSEYEVLEAVEKKGKISYNRIGTVKPITGKIWDNRYMAVEEGAPGAELSCTTFKITSGHNIEVGHFIRQLK